MREKKIKQDKKAFQNSNEFEVVLQITIDSLKKIIGAVHM